MNVIVDNLPSIVTLLVAVLIQVITLRVSRQTNLHQAELARLEREHAAQETRRAEWKQYLIELMKQMMLARESYEEFLGSDNMTTKRQSAIIGKAISVCLASNDDELIKLADKVLTPYFVDDPELGDFQSRNRNGLRTATYRLAQLIKNT